MQFSWTSFLKQERFNKSLLKLSKHFKNINPYIKPCPFFFLFPCSVQKVVLCSGKHYYALLKQRETSAANQTTALIRVEELCPFPLEPLQQELKKYPKAKGMCTVSGQTDFISAITTTACMISVTVEKFISVRFVFGFCLS